MSEKTKCFIIQPFTDEYNKRCKETYKPAIEEAGLAPYRVDEDYNPKELMIQMIKEGIKKSDVCLAEISENSPNVWYELGFADGHDIPVVLICEKGKREGRLPFDVNQRGTYFYSTDSQGDWEKLQEEIAKRLRKAVNGEKLAEKDSVTKDSSSDKSEFGGTELFVLGFLYFNPDMNNSDRGVSRLINEMKMLEFSQEARDAGFRKLEFKKMIEISATFKDEEPYISLTQKGDTWCSSNERQVEFYHSLIRNFEP